MVPAAFSMIITLISIICFELVLNNENIMHSQGHLDESPYDITKLPKKI